MFYMVELEDIGIIRPNELRSGNLKQLLADKFRSKYVGRYLSEIGLILDVLEITDYGLGKSIIGSPCIYLKVRFKALTYLPKVNELVEGEIRGVSEYGVTINIGPIDGFIHISQLGDDVFVQRVAGFLYGKKTRVSFRRGDWVRARVTAVTKPDFVAAARGEPIVRVSLTCKQPGLGKIEKEDEGKEEEKEKKENKGGGKG